MPDEVKPVQTRTNHGALVPLPGSDHLVTGLAPDALTKRAPSPDIFEAAAPGFVEGLHVAGRDWRDVYYDDPNDTLLPVSNSHWSRLRGL